MFVWPRGVDPLFHYGQLVETTSHLEIFSQDIDLYDKIGGEEVLVLRYRACVSEICEGFEKVRDHALRVPEVLSRCRLRAYQP